MAGNNGTARIRLGGPDDLSPGARDQALPATAVTGYSGTSPDRSTLTESPPARSCGDCAIVLQPDPGAGVGPCLVAGPGTAARAAAAAQRAGTTGDRRRSA